MTKINYQQRTTPTGNATFDTEHLVIDTSGKVFTRSSHNGQLIPLTTEQMSVVGKHFGVLLGDACLALKALS